MIMIPWRAVLHELLYEQHTESAWFLAMVGVPATNLAPKRVFQVLNIGGNQDLPSQPVPAPGRLTGCP